MSLLPLEAVQMACTGTDPFAPMMTFITVSETLRDQRKLLLEAMPVPEIGLQRIGECLRRQEETVAQFGGGPYGDQRHYIGEFKDLMEKSRIATESNEKYTRRAKINATLSCAYVGCCRLKQRVEEEVPQKRCSVCKTVYYCSAECQKKDWMKWHKPACRLIAAEQQQG